MPEDPRGPRRRAEDRLARLEGVIPQKDAELKRLRRQIGQIIAERDEMAQTLDLVTSIEEAAAKPPKWLRPEASSNMHRATPCLVLSDLHFDENVDPAEVEFYNAYSREIGELRLKTTTTAAIKLARHYMSGLEFDGIVCMLGGDILSGDIHEELARTNHGTVFDAIVHWVPQIAAALELLADEFGRVHVPCVVGNHDRNPANRRVPSKLRARNSLTWIIYHWLADRFRDDDRVTVQVAEGADLSFDIYDTRFLLTHGDQFKGGNGIAGLWSPIMRGLHKKQQRQTRIGAEFDWLVMGHFHQYIFGQGVIVNGSMKGFDEYAYTQNFAPEPPQQAFFVVTPERGITMSMPIDCRSQEETWTT